MCQIPDCRKRIGPYCDPRQADAALADHNYIAHQAVRQATPAMHDGTSGRSEWPPVHT